MNKVTTIAVGCLAVLLMIGPAAIAGNGATRAVGDASGTLATAPRAPAKPPRTVAPPPPDARILRQGGDTIADAIELPDLNYTTTGTTAGYTDDHDEACPYDGSTSPDVVYTFVVWGVTTTISMAPFSCERSSSAGMGLTSAAAKPSALDRHVPLAVRHQDLRP